MQDNELKLASDFQPLQGEANFGPPILREVVGGAHIAPECVTVFDGKFVMTEWPNGLARHDKKRTVRFPHGLIRFGETFEQCAERLVTDQLGMAVERVKVVYIYSYLDESKHWHLEPLLMVWVSGEPKLPTSASKIIVFEGDKLPDGAVWSSDSFIEAYAKYISPELAASN
jgi:8-oxo-dGTP pyrophosphatase MutT (NUDIX family)